MNNHCDKNKLHKILMILCCALPILLIGVLYLTKVQGTPWGSILSFGLILLCPLSHFIIMPFKHGKEKENNEGSKQSCH